MVITDSDYEGPAIEALGSLFKVTQVFLWDDGLQVPHSTAAAERSSKLIEADDDDDDNHDPDPVPDWSDLTLLKDLELTREMNELGLPISFQTNKEKSRSAKSKRKSARSKLPRSCNNSFDETLNKVTSEEVVFPAKFHDKTNSSLCCISMLGQSESSYCDGAEEVDTAEHASGEGDNSTCCTGFADGVSMVKNNNRNNEEIDSFCGTEFGEIDYECLELPKIVCKQTECETIFDDDGTPTWQPPGNESESLPMSLEGIGEWVVFWDTFYMRRYFYNIKTQTSTWDPPTGMEHLAFGGCSKVGDSEALKEVDQHQTQDIIQPPEETLIVENLSGKHHEDCSADTGVAVRSLVSGFATDREDQSHHNSDDNPERSRCNDGVSCSSESNTLDHVISSIERCIQPTSEVDLTPMENMVIDMSGLDSESDPIVSKQGKKGKRKNRKKKFYHEIEDLQFQNMPEAYSAIISKYWCQRYILFSRFDDGVKMDEEGWFSVTPEVIAEYQASRCASGTIIDCFTGVGGNAIQFAQRCRHVIAIDIDPLKIDYARHNAAIYGVDDQIDFIMGDFFLLAPKLKADTVFLSPPWGGPDYAKVKAYDMKTMLRPHDGFTLFNVAKEIASRVVMFLPRNIKFNQLAELSLSACPQWSLEVEKVYLNNKLKAITAYFSETPVGGC